MIFQSFRHFSGIFLKSAEKELLPGHVAYSPSSRDSSRECLRGKRGATGRYPGWSYGSGHVALSEDIRRDSPGLGTRDTWHSPKEKSERVSRYGFPDMWHAPKEKSERVSRYGFRDTWHAPKEKSERV